MGRLLIPVLETIDAIHADGVLPSVPVSWLPPSEATDEGGRYYLGDASGSGIAIEVSQQGVTPHLSFAHEIGHLLDHQTLGERGAYASDAEHPRMRGWWDAVQCTATGMRWQRTRTERRLPVTLADGREMRVRVDMEAVRVLTQRSEMFARSYAQYIATVGSNTALADELHAALDAQCADLFSYPRYWESADFVLIREALDALLRQLGWRVG
jgi:hypothetical protein